MPSSPLGLLPPPPVPTLRTASGLRSQSAIASASRAAPIGPGSTRSNGAAPRHPNRVRASAFSSHCLAASPWAVGGSLALCFGQNGMGRYANG